MTASPSSTARKPPKPRSSISRSSDLLGSLPRSKRPPRSTLLPCAPEPRRPTGEIHAVEHRNTTVYVHSWPSLRDAQLSQRETDQPTDVSPVDTDEEGYLYRDELLATFLSVAVSEIQSIPPERAAALVLRQFEGDSFDALERRLRRNHSFREALDYEPEDVPDGTSLWRAFDDLHPDELRDCLQSMCGDLLADHDHAGEFVVIDGTHIAAWANTREEIDDGEVEGASWGKHEGSSTGTRCTSSWT